MSTSSLLSELCPAPPRWTVDWSRVEDRLPWVAQLFDCPQDATFHAEGDVGIHTKLACEMLAAHAPFRALPAAERELVFAGILFHDWGKLYCTKHEADGRISSRGHSSRGEALTRAFLWRMNVDPGAREQVAALVRYHQIPFFLVDRDDAERLAITVSQTVRCDLLALVAWADGAGRRCRDDADQRRILDNVALFREYCDERDLLSTPFAFASEHSRFLYFRKPDRDPHYLAHDDTKSDVIVLSGLPGAGKDHWVRTRSDGRTVISLDDLRRELDIDPEDPQGSVIHAARERARDLLRRGDPFVWNGTNVSRPLRQSVISLFADYHARVRIVYLECDEPQLLERNRQRAARIPETVIHRLVDRWSVPDLTEAHRVDHT